MQILDREVVAELRDMLEDELDELFDELLQQVPQALTEIRQYAEDGDLGSVEQKVHQIKGSASNLGVMLFAESCRQLEEGIRSGEIDDPLPQLLPLQETFAQAVNEIKAMMGS